MVTDEYMDFAAVRADVGTFLYRWAGTEDVALDSRGGSVDARKLATLETFIGVGFENAYMGALGADAIDGLFEDLVNFYSARIVVGRAPFAELTELRHDWLSDEVVGDAAAFIEEFGQNTPAGLAAATEFWLANFKWVDLLASATGTAASDYDVAYAQAFGDAVQAIDVSSSRSTTFTWHGGTCGDDVLAASDDQQDVMAGGSGNDTLKGGYGSDTYLFELGDGQDVVYDTGSSSDVDRLVFGDGIATGDIQVTRSASDADDVILSVAGTSDSITNSPSRTVRCGPMPM